MLTLGFKKQLEVVLYSLVWQTVLHLELGSNMVNMFLKGGFLDSQDDGKLTQGQKEKADASG